MTAFRIVSVTGAASAWLSDLPPASPRLAGSLHNPELSLPALALIRPSRPAWLRSARRLRPTRLRLRLAWLRLARRLRPTRLRLRLGCCWTWSVRRGALPALPIVRQPGERGRQVGRRVRGRRRLDFCNWWWLRGWVCCRYAGSNPLQAGLRRSALHEPLHAGTDRGGLGRRHGLGWC